MFNVNIKTKIALINLSISIISVLILSILFYYIYSHSLIKSTINMNKQYTKYLSDYLSDYFKQIESTTVEIYNETEPVKVSILDIMKNGYSTNVSDYYTEHEILNKYFMFIQNQRKSIVKAIIISKNHTIVDTWNRNSIYSNINLNNTLLNTYVYKNPDNSLFFSYLEPTLNKNIIVYKKNIYDLFSHKKIATLLFFIDFDTFKWEKYNFNNNSIIVVNKYNQIIYHSDKTNISKNINNDIMKLYNNNVNEYYPDKLNNKNQLITYVNLSKFNLKLINIATLDELEKNKSVATNITLIIVISVILLNFIISTLFASKVTKPIKTLCNAMKEIEKGNFNVKIPETNKNDEIEILNKSFNFMTSKIKNMIKFQYELEIKNREAQLMVLQSQINPHFLYNTLNTISGRAILNNDYEISTMCKALSDIFRYSIQSNSRKSTIENELFHVSNYLYIQKIRFDNCIEVNVDIEDDLKNCLIPHFILQPIIENSIMYGIEKTQMDKEEININIKKIDKNIVIIIEDNGPGIEQEKLIRIKKHVNRKPMEISSGLTKRPSIGLRNVNVRLKIFYGNQYGLELYNKKEKGLKVILTIPYEKENKNV